MANYLIEDSTITAIANAIRTKDGTTAAIKGSDIAERIAAIVSGGAEFYGGPIETGTVVIPAGAFVGTISHSLGVAKGIILYGKYLINGESSYRDELWVDIPDDIIQRVSFIDGVYDRNSDLQIINTNDTNSLQFFQMFSIQEAAELSYIILGA